MCAPTELKQQCDDYDMQGVKGAACYCNGNLCNGGSKQFTNILALVAMAIGAIGVSLAAFRQ